MRVKRKFEIAITPNQSCPGTQPRTKLEHRCRCTFYEHMIVQWLNVWWVICKECCYSNVFILHCSLMHWKWLLNGCNVYVQISWLLENWSEDVFFLFWKNTNVNESWTVFFRFNGRFLNEILKKCRLKDCTI